MRKTFSFTGAKKIVFGNGSLLTLAGHVKELNAQNPLVVIDKNLAKTDLLEKVANILIPAGMKFTVYDKVVPEPPIELADEGAKIAVKDKCDIVIGLGGGSAMDVAKAIAVLATNKGAAADYVGLNKVPKLGL
ncbi:MAG: iron-containing alcohol dehydrogenase, partial [Smithella sp.]